MQIGPHKHVVEYDGAFSCGDCWEQWGALPGDPVAPSVCELSELQSERQQLEQDIRAKQERLAVVFREIHAGQRTRKTAEH